MSDAVVYGIGIIGLVLVAIGVYAVINEWRDGK